jgi:hypothetical protein
VIEITELYSVLGSAGFSAGASAGVSTGLKSICDNRL